MKFRQFYRRNKPLCNALFTGLLYFLFCWSVAFSERAKELFIIIMLWLPGISFPLSTCYFTKKRFIFSSWQQFVHLLFSIGIYNGAIWIFSLEAQVKYSFLLAGFSGSFLFLLQTKYLLKKQLSLLQIILCALLSGFVFFQFEFVVEHGFAFALPVFLWTLVNCLLLNLEFRKVNQDI